MKRILAVVFALCMVLCLTGCSSEGEQIAGVALEQAVTIIARLLEAMIAVAGTWLLSKLRQKTQLSNTQAAVEMVLEMTRQTVGELQQTVVQDLKELGGKLTPEEIRALNEELLRLTKLKLTIPVMDLIEAMGADIDVIIKGEAEKVISEYKGIWWMPAAQTEPADQGEPAVTLYNTVQAEEE